MATNNGNVTIARSVELFLQEAGANSGQTARTYRAALKHLLNYLETERQVEPGQAMTFLLTPDLIRDFIAWLAQNYRGPQGQSLSKNSRALYHVAFSRYYRYLFINKWLPPEVDPASYEALRDSLAKTAKRKNEPLEKKLPGEEIVEALIEQARLPLPPNDKLSDKSRRRLHLAWLRDQAIVLMLQSSGMRVSELVGLRRGDLNYTDQGAYVTGKGDKTRFVRFSTEAWEALTTYLQERADGELAVSLAQHPIVCRHDKGAGGQRKPLTTKTIRQIIERLAQQANISERFHMTPHRLRHYFATKLLRETDNLALTQTSLGHEDPRTTRIYAEVNQADLINAHKRVFDRK